MENLPVVSSPLTHAVIFSTNGEQRFDILSETHYGDLVGRVNFIKTLRDKHYSVGNILDHT